ncbi:glycosyltransferase family 4 protein [Novosphingobium pituita]|uniref:Glycosyl transferase family 1 domain-containing protein n=1 Tax=Novosphingobium pituita TaxID=3056842 RepID=A0ABQ6P9I1_9SPHN|nr:glycosyltransferase [Novosphingobium sp. IK01]GMM61915.1 hypothetical protein NUTIK01_26920 [Novosphingobium sp. IK01]
MRICLIGGSPAQPGGLEAFCDRVAAAARGADDLAITQFSTNTAYRPLRSMALLPWRLVALRRALRGCDLAWVQVSNLPEAYYVVLARLAGGRVLVTPHFGANSKLVTHRVVRPVVHALLGRAHRMALLFAGQEAEIGLPVRVPVSVLGSFLPANAFVAGGQAVSGAPLRLIHAARFSAAKGTLRMLEVCARLARAGVPFRARLIGRGDPETMAQIERMIAAEGLGASVELTGWLDEAALQQALREADVLVHLSMIDSFPLIVLEALAAGTLPLVWPMAGVEAMLEGVAGLEGRGGMVVDPADPVSSGFALLTTGSPDELRARGEAVGKAARATFGWPAMLDRLRTIAAATLERPARRG